MIFAISTPLSPRIDDSRIGSIRSKRDYFPRAIDGTRVRESKPNVNEGFTVDFFQKISTRCTALCLSLSLSLYLSLAFFPDRFSLFLSRLRPRARGQPRNRPAGKRECISRLLSFPSIFYRREKNTPKEGSVYVCYMCTCLSRARVCCVCRRGSSVSVTCDSPAHAARCTRRRFTAHYRFHTLASRSIRRAGPIRRGGLERNRAESSGVVVVVVVVVSRAIPIRDTARAIGFRSWKTCAPNGFSLSFTSVASFSSLGSSAKRK